MDIEPTIKDVSRAVARLDAHADISGAQTVDIGGTEWTGDQLRISVARNLAWTIGRTVRLPKVAKRDAALMLAAHGASQFTVERHARAIAALLRSDFANHSWSAGI